MSEKPQNKNHFKEHNSTLRTQVTLLQRHIKKIMIEREVLRDANEKKMKSIISKSKRLVALLNQIENGEHYETRNI